jgi:flagellar motor switch protein FliM
MPISIDQPEIDSGFTAEGAAKPERKRARGVIPFDFRRPDRISKAQLRAIHQLHDHFARTLGASLSGWLRTYAVVNLVSVEQLSYSEFLGCVSSPTCLVSLGMKPYDGNAILEINSALIFPLIEILLGGNGKIPFTTHREMTEIEQAVLDGFFAVVLRDLGEAWKPVTPLDFAIEKIEAEPQMLQVMAPTEAVVAVAIEIRIGEAVGMMNIAMPSLNVRRMRQTFDRQWQARKALPTATDQARVMKLITQSELRGEAVLTGPQLRLRDLIDLDEGDVLGLEYPIGEAVDLLVSGKRKFRGEIVNSSNRAAFRVTECCEKRVL